MNQDVTETRDLAVLDTRDVLGKPFNIYGTPDAPLFLAKDVAAWIGYDASSINKMLGNVDDAEKVRNIVPTLGGNQEAWFLSEDGLYEVLMQSRKPVAKQFKAEVKAILKTIRKTGGFVANEDTFIDTYLPSADEATRVLFKGTLQVIRSMDGQIKELAPKAKVYDALCSRDNLLNLRDAAKVLGVQPRQFTNLLVVGGYLYRDKKGRLLPYSNSKAAGMFQVREYVNPYNQSTGIQTLVTFEGQQKLARVLERLTRIAADA